MSICTECKKPIRFWQKKLDYLLTFDTKTGEETTELMHRSCGIDRKYMECFGQKRYDRWALP